MHHRAYNFVTTQYAKFRLLLFSCRFPTIGTRCIVKNFAFEQVSCKDGRCKAARCVYKTCNLYHLSLERARRTTSCEMVKKFCSQKPHTHFPAYLLQEPGTEWPDIPICAKRRTLRRTMRWSLTLWNLKENSQLKRTDHKIRAVNVKERDPVESVNSS